MPEVTADRTGNPSGRLFLGADLLGRHISRFHRSCRYWQPPIDPRSFEQRTSDGYLLSPSRLHSRRKNARDILSNLGHAIALESVVP